MYSHGDPTGVITKVSLRLKLRILQGLDDPNMSRKLSPYERIRNLQGPSTFPSRGALPSCSGQSLSSSRFLQALPSRSDVQV